MPRISLAIHLPPREDQTAFNLEVWERVLADPSLAKIEGRSETNRHGQILMSPPPGPRHSSIQSRILILLDRLLDAHPLVECPISTSDCVRAADVGWFTRARYERAFRGPCFNVAPEICVEVLSPTNQPAQIAEKIALYFDSGAREVWICELDGGMRFHGPEVTLPQSVLCPDFPRRIEA